MSVDFDELRDDKPQETGWYATQHCWDESEGAWASAHYWDGEHWWDDRDARIWTNARVLWHPSRFETKADAKDWAEHNISEW